MVRLAGAYVSYATRPRLGPDVTHMVTLDPGTRRLGVAGWERADDASDHPDAWSLVTACDVLTSYASVDAAVHELHSTPAHTWAGPSCVLVSEYPTLYAASRVTHGTIRELRLVVEHAERNAWSACHRVHPRGWKGQVPKRIHHARIGAALTEAESEAWWDTLGPDARDAIGIGLWATRRM